MVFEKIFSVLLIIIFALYNVESNGNQNNGFQEVDTDCGPVQGKLFSKKAVSYTHLTLPTNREV